MSQSTLSVGRVNALVCSTSNLSHKLVPAPGISVKAAEAGFTLPREFDRKMDVSTYSECEDKKLGYFSYS